MTTTDPTGAQLRDEGIGAVLAADVAVHRGHADDIWAVIDKLIAEGREFTAEDVRNGLPVDLRERLTPNLLPAVIRTAASRGEIIALGFTTSRRARRHGGVLRRWVAATAVTDDRNAA